jgi:hypothetical protein
MNKKLKPDDIISHSEMCLIEGYSLQKGMNFRVGGGTTVILMSQRTNAPYEDKRTGDILIYEGHNIPKRSGSGINPKSMDQSAITSTGKLTENGKFVETIKKYKKGEDNAELVRVYEKIKPGIWSFVGLFELIDYNYIKSKRENRKVFKFKLKVTDKASPKTKAKIKIITDLEHTRMIPASIKLEVWKRDKGQCVKCGSKDNLHFDHMLPFAKGGTSLLAQNIQLLCARHNLQKRDKIQ